MDGLLDGDGGGEKKVRRRKKHTLCLTGEEGKKPWRDPDPHPKETHFKYGADSSPPYYQHLTLYSRYELAF